MGKEQNERITLIKNVLLKKIILPCAYKICCIIPSDKNLFLFADGRSVSMPDNMKFVYDELISKGYKCNTHFVKDKNSTIKNTIDNIKFMYLYSRASVLLLTDYYMPVYTVKPRKNTKVIQLWHACGAFKKFGYSTIDLPWGMSREIMEKFPIHNTYTHTFVSSDNIRCFYAEAFNTSIDNIYALGCSRTDVYYDDNHKINSKEKLQRIIGKDNNKKVVLYAPTFRGEDVKTARNDNILDFEKLYNAIGDEYIILCKFHPFLSATFEVPKEYSDFAYNVTDELTIDEAMISSDILITDYSSLLFEFALLYKPIILYPYDLEDYLDSRGLYLDYEEYAIGDIVYNNDELILAIKNACSDYDYQKNKEFNNYFMSACDGNSTERIVSKIIE